MIAPATGAGGGRIAEVMGDGLLVEFASPVAAVRAALRVQREIAVRVTGPEDARLRFRVGINLGDVVIDGEDVLADAVNVAARLESLAPVGGLCIGWGVFDHARGRVDAEMTPLGPQAVKNIPEPVEVWRVEVEGSVRRGGDRLRVTAQLIEAAAGAHAWAERWDRRLDDFLALQDEMAEAILTAVEPELGAHERRLARAKPTGSLTAWELCQRGFATLLTTYDSVGLEAARTDLRRASEAEPDFALPYAPLARSHWNAIGRVLSDDVQADVAAAPARARQALALDDRLDATCYPLTILLAGSGVLDDARAAGDRSVALNPGDPMIRHARACAEMAREAPDAAFIEADEREALRLSPRDPQAWSFLQVRRLGVYLRTGDLFPSGGRRGARRGLPDRACRPHPVPVARRRACDGGPGGRGAPRPRRGAATQSGGVRGARGGGVSDTLVAARAGAGAARLGELVPFGLPRE